MSDVTDYEDFNQLEQKFNTACSCLKSLNSNIAIMQTRYDRASKVNRRSYRYTLRIRLVVMEGIRNMYYHYAMQKAEELEQAKEHIEQTLSDSEEEEDMEYWNQQYSFLKMVLFRANNFQMVLFRAKTYSQKKLSSIYLLPRKFK